MSTIGEERAFNPRLQVKSVQEYVELMNSLNLPNPKLMDVGSADQYAGVGLAQIFVADKGWALSAEQVRSLLEQQNIALIDLREDRERKKQGIISGSLHVAYPRLEAELQEHGLLQQLAKDSGKGLVFFCAFGERSAMAVQAAQKAGLTDSRHMQGGLEAGNWLGPL